MLIALGEGKQQLTAGPGLECTQQMIKQIEQISALLDMQATDRNE